MSARLQEILFLVFSDMETDPISIHHQSRNSDGSPRKPKYSVHLEKLDAEIVDKMKPSP